jgi:hypothetical protein
MYVFQDLGDALYTKYMADVRYLDKVCIVRHHIPCMEIFLIALLLGLVDVIVE